MKIRRETECRRQNEGRRSAIRGFQLIEALVYIAVIFVVLGAGYEALYRCMDSSITLRRNADDIASALHAGERWRADVRLASRQIRVEQTPSEQIVHLEGPRGEVAYRFATNAVLRRVGDAPGVRLLPSVKSSVMEADPRRQVTAWRWELELKPRQQANMKPGRVRPLFTFIAVPEGSPSQ